MVHLATIINRLLLKYKHKISCGHKKLSYEPGRLKFIIQLQNDYVKVSH